MTAVSAVSRVLGRASVKDTPCPRDTDTGHLVRSRAVHRSGSEAAAGQNARSAGEPLGRGPEDRNPTGASPTGKIGLPRPLPGRASFESSIVRSSSQYMDAGARGWRMNDSKHALAEGVVKSHGLDLAPDLGEPGAAFAGRVLDALSERIADLVSGSLAEQAEGFYYGMEPRREVKALQASVADLSSMVNDAKALLVQIPGEVAP